MEVAKVLDAVTARRWADLAVAALAEDRAAIDRINVYPVADADTGTNLLLTMRSAVAELSACTAGGLGEVLAALAKGALGGARGNSGVLLSQVLRGLADELRDAESADGAALTRALLRADGLARDAVAEPVDGTLLSVLHAAAQAADSGSRDLHVVLRAATRAAVSALDETPAQLPVLAEAGVVDAGGRGLVILLDTLHAVVHDGVRLAPDPPAGRIPPKSPHHESGYAYEVMYLLGGATDEATTWLRDTLCGIGDCVSVVGDGADAWAVHVHCDDIGAAIESGIEAGRVHRIQVTRFADQHRGYERDAAVLACVRGGALAELFEAEGADVLRLADLPEPAGADELSAAVAGTRAAHVVLLPNDEAATAIAEEAAGRAVVAGQDVVVVPTVSPVQGLAALAVHDPSRRRADDAVAMTEAAAATRRGELRIADSEALTWAGRCQPGDVLGLVDGEVVLLGSDVGEVARVLADRILTAGGELVTALADTGAPESLPEVLAEHLRRTHPEVELNCYPGGELGAVLLLGVE
ncbi:DAK2 domain-containing protein [Saccharopolyspora erythraea]|uniref:DAK2 domain-containing protein n=1 Tax=Saccharopolyspora erythraea TaxID=1836 RepID=UPI001BA886EC|nr:DAK2 domain-containing protein [Saccharopolyspora erythraea]QUH04566.1 DAK2 domain-containing protein [Saccharopolyspora erythraea]